MAKAGSCRFEYLHQQLMKEFSAYNQKNYSQEQRIDFLTKENHKLRDKIKSLRAMLGELFSEDEIDVSQSDQSHTDTSSQTLQTPENSCTQSSPQLFRPQLSQPSENDGQYEDS